MAVLRVRRPKSSRRQSGADWRPHIGAEVRSRPGIIGAIIKLTSAWLPFSGAGEWEPVRRNVPRHGLWDKAKFSGRGDDVFKRLAADKAVDVSGNIAQATLDGSIGPWRAVRRHDHVRPGERMPPK